MNHTVCEKNMCNGCMACVACCPVDAIKMRDDMKECNAMIDVDKCIECGLCKKICPNQTPVRKCKPAQWYQGWSMDGEQRKMASSGGIAGALARSFVRLGGFVCSCVFEQGEFTFRMINREEELVRFSGSKYVKSNPIDSYQVVGDALKKGERVIFIGLPCQVAAMKNILSETIQKNLYTVDIICHGTPSPKLLKFFLEQNGYDIRELSDIKFREKERENRTYRKINDVGSMDSYMMTYLNSLSLTENCYNCQFASPERVSDITLGDSWGSELSNEEKQKGISLILCQSEKGEWLLEKAQLHLEEVDIEKAVNSNRQLRCSSKKPKRREVFFSLIRKEKRLKTAVRKILPAEWIKQVIKEWLQKIKVYRGRSEVTYRIVIKEGE